MSTVLITYSTPPPPPDPQVPHGPAIWPSGHVATHVDPVDVNPLDVSRVEAEPVETLDPTDPASPVHGGRVSSYAMATAGIDEAIAAAIAEEVARAGHRVTCRPVVAAPPSDIYDLVVAVDGLHVSHWGGPSQRSRATTTPGPTGPSTEPPYASERALRHTAAHAEGHESGVETTIPMTWCADWRAVDAWSRTLGEQLVHHLALRHELTMVRAELERCREQLRATASTAKAAPSAQRLTKASSSASDTRETDHGGYERQRLSAGVPSVRSRP